MRTLLIIVAILLTATIAGYCAVPTALIKDVRGEIEDDTAQIVIEANCDIDYVDYVLDNPPRLVIDPVGKVYTDLKDVIMFESGPVKKVTITKGQTEEGLGGSFYPLDFITMELNEKPEYKVKKEIKQLTLVVDIGRKKTKTAIVSQLTRVVEEQPEAEAEEEVPSAVPGPLPVQKQNEPAVAIEPLPTQTPDELPAAAEPLPAQKPVPEAAGATESRPQTIPEMESLPAESSAPIPLNEPLKQEAPAGGVISGEPIKMVYMIGEGDILDVSVWQHPDLDKKVVVRPDGYISIPLAGDIKASGRTPPQTAVAIREGLSRMIKDPQVTVIVSNFGSKNIFVLGEVSKPGSYAYRGGISILDAISSAGGWKNSAVLNSVMVVRKAFTDAPEAHRLDVYALIKKGDFTQNLPLEPGDIIYVPQSFVANIGSFIENLRISVGAYVSETTRIFN